MLPTLDPQQPDETGLQYGARALAFILQTGVIGTLDTPTLARADQAAGFAVSARGIYPLAADRLSEVRHWIAAVLRQRAAQVPAAAEVPPSRPDDRPTLGPMAPLAPAPITQPPAPVYRVPPTPIRTPVRSTGPDF
jgi:hypothetical protein